MSRSIFILHINKKQTIIIIPSAIVSVTSWLFGTWRSRMMILKEPRLVFGEWISIFLSCFVLLKSHWNYNFCHFPSLFEYEKPEIICETMAHLKIYLFVVNVNFFEKQANAFDVTVTYMRHVNTEYKTTLIQEHHTQFHEWHKQGTNNNKNFVIGSQQAEKLFCVFFSSLHFAFWINTRTPGKTMAKWYNRAHLVHSLSCLDWREWNRWWWKMTTRNT